MPTAVEALASAVPNRSGAIRSRLGGALLIAVSPVLALLFFALLLEFISNVNFIFLGGVLALCGAGLGIDAGRRMRLLDGWDELKRDPRPPVIFLRPFREDDRKEYSSPVGTRLGADVPAAGKVKSVTPEPKIAQALRLIGPFVAVGKPGEWLAPFGAARLYLDNEHWQDIVAFLIAHAMAVVLQPDVSPGTCWELEAAVRFVDPRRIVMLVPNSGIRPLGFERIRWLTGQVLPVQLPEGVACDAFVFDEHWSPLPLQFANRPDLAVSGFIAQVRGLKFEQERRDAFAAFVHAVRR